MKPRITPNITKILAIAIGLLVGYVNFRAAMTFFFIISNTDTPLVLIAILGYASLLPLTVIGLFYPARAATILLIVTAMAFLCGLLPSPVWHAAIYMGTRFVLPNVAVALLFRTYAKLHSRGLPSVSPQ
jgi:hypothetical protein